MLKMEIPPLVLGGNFTAGTYQMFSAQSEDTKPRYKILLGKLGTIWLVTTNEDPDHIIVQGGPESKGYGGADLTFTLANGVDKITLHGPWHSNTDALFKDTGLDLRNKIKTWGCIGRKRSWHRQSNWGDSQTVIEDLIYFDHCVIAGAFDRIQDMAQKMSNAMGITLYYYMQSYSGGSSGPVDPKNLLEHGK